MPNSTAYKLLEACRGRGCPICTLEQQSVERYLDNHFYESVNSPAWRERLRLSRGFCPEHAWLGVNQRLGDALGYSIIYQDVIHTILKELHEGDHTAPVPRRWADVLGQMPEQTRNNIEKILSAITLRERCPVCDQRDEILETSMSVLVKELEHAEMSEALHASDGLCIPHLRLALKYVKAISVSETLLRIHREKLESLHAELAEFIRRNDYQVIEQGFGKEGDAWLRAIGMLTGNRKKW